MVSAVCLCGGQSQPLFNLNVLNYNQIRVRLMSTNLQAQWVESGSNLRVCFVCCYLVCQRRGRSSSVQVLSTSIHQNMNINTEQVKKRDVLFSTTS